MKAWVLKNIKEIPQLTEITEPVTDTDKVKVQVYASALNHRDIWIADGLYAKIQLPVVLGSDGCGLLNDREVIINPGWYWGQNESAQSAEFRVLGMPDQGTFAESIAVSESFIYEKPDHLSKEEAAALPLAGVTAWRAFMTKCLPDKGNKVLISGIGGGVALFALQFALAVGCEVWVTSGSDDKILKSKALGAAGGVNYKSENWPVLLQSQAGGFDIIIDSAGGSGFRHFIKLCNPGGKISVYGATHGQWDGLNPQHLFWKQISVYGSTMGSDADFRAMIDFVSIHKIRPIIDTVFPFSQLNKGFDRMKSGEQFGKIVFLHHE